MKRKTLSILLAISIIASMSVSMTGCGKKEKVVEPVETEKTVTTETNKDGMVITTTKNGNTTTTTKTYKEGNVTYNIKSTESVIDENTPMDEEGYKIIEAPHINLSYIGDARKNDIFKAKLNGFEITDDLIKLNIDTDIDLVDGFYTINAEKGEKLGQDKIGLTFREDTAGNKVVEFDRTIFDNLPENSNLEANWRNNPIFFFLNDAKDNVIIVDAFFNL